jgi:hypothetical protein
LALSPPTITEGLNVQQRYVNLQSKFWAGGVVRDPRAVAHFPYANVTRLISHGGCTFINRQELKMCDYRIHSQRGDLLVIRVPKGTIRGHDTAKHIMAVTGKLNATFGLREDHKHYGSDQKDYMIPLKVEPESTFNLIKNQNIPSLPDLCFRAHHVMTYTDNNSVPLHQQVVSSKDPTGSVFYPGYIGDMTGKVGSRPYVDPDASTQNKITTKFTYAFIN